MQNHKSNFLAQKKIISLQKCAFNKRLKKHIATFPEYKLFAIMFHIKAVQLTPFQLYDPLVSNLTKYANAVRDIFYQL